MKTRGGGWTVLQHRTNGSVNFHRGWRDYKVVGSSDDRARVHHYQYKYMGQYCATGQEVRITIHGWFGTERRGRRLACDPTWPALVGFGRPHVLYQPPCYCTCSHSLSLFILPHAHTMYFSDHRALLFVCIPLDLSSFPAKGNECGDDNNNISESKT